MLEIASANSLQTLTTLIGRAAEAWWRQQWSAITWVHKANERAEQLYERMSNGQAADDADPAEAMLVREHMTNRAIERSNKEARRESVDSKAEVWESRMSDMARAMRETAEQQREHEHAPGLEIDR